MIKDQDGPVRFLYVYQTGERSDGMRTAVSRSWETGIDGTIALFRNPADALAFAYKKQEETGCMVHPMPSTEEAIRFQEENVNMWGTDKRLIDSEEFCPDCEREVPFHYEGCPTRK